MAVSSSLFTSSLQGSMVAPKTLKCYREYMCSPSNLSYRQSGYTNTFEVIARWEIIEKGTN